MGRCEVESVGFGVPTVAHGDAGHDRVPSEVAVGVPYGLHLGGAGLPSRYERREWVLQPGVLFCGSFPHQVGHLREGAGLEPLLGCPLNDNPAEEEFLACLRPPRGRRDQVLELAERWVFSRRAAALVAATFPHGFGEQSEGTVAGLGYGRLPVGFARIWVIVVTRHGRQLLPLSMWPPASDQPGAFLSPRIIPVRG